MRNLIFTLLTCTVIFSCKTEKKTGTQAVSKPAEIENTTIENTTIKEKESLVSITPVSNDMMETAVIYEANIRQYSTEGTFDAFTKDIPELKKLGVKIIWLMPVFPISETKRKATGDKFVSDIEDTEARKKYLGSYYAVSDFTKINPEFGDLIDFRELINTAHTNGIYVILDWIPNHTGWNHSWLKTNPEFYTKNAKGEITDPLNEDGSPIGWADVADLNYDNEQLHKAMISDMKYWLTQEGVDGFRCDVAGSVPLKFWEKAVPQLRAEKDIFMLAEAWEPELLKGNDLFDMCYAWEGHAIMNEIAKGNKSLKDWNKYTLKVFSDYETDDILMNFITNHDENSWNGTVKERMGDAAEIMLAFSYVMEGMPLIYSGQEYGLDHRLKFFEKDSIPKIKGEMWTTLERLGHLKSTHPALNGGKQKASTLVFETNNDNILKFTRSKSGSKMTFIGNFSEKEQTFRMNSNGKFIDYMTNKEIQFNYENFTLKPWEYKILVDK